MNILWLVNIPLPEASELLNEPSTPLGGWLINASSDMADQENVKLSLAFPYKKALQVEKLEGEKIRYYPFYPIKKPSRKNVEALEEIIKKEKPDLVHIHGTEWLHSLEMVRACQKMGIEYVVSIQGLVSVYSMHLFANLPFSAVYKKTLRNILIGDSVNGLKHRLIERGKDEIEALKNAPHVIGRTTWDQACTKQINPNTQYHFCNETLRESFYEDQWNIDRCERNAIFLSQGSHSVKGLHYMIEALPLILAEFPETKVYVGGKDITKTDTARDRLMQTYYGKYIKKKIKELQIEDKVIFTGVLQEKEMKEKYLASHVFVCPSSIENSPNSLGEAMILGVPCVASSVGGIPDMLKHREEGYIYQTDAPYMLAYYVCQIFKDDQLAQDFSKKGRKRALQTHDRAINTNSLLKIYENVINQES